DPAIRAALSQLDYFIARNGTDPTAHFVSAALHLDMTGVEQTKVRIEASLHPVDTVVPGPTAVYFANETASYGGTDYTLAGRWVVDGANFVRDITALGAVQRDWQLVDTGDFNGDLKVDMLWQNRATGDVAVWVMDGDNFLHGQTVYTPTAGEGWKIAGSADFTGDGRSDILLATTVVDPSGGLSSTALKLLQVQADGVTLESATAIPGADAGWTVAGAGDFNGDGRADILWRYSTGLTAVWEMDGSSVLGGGTVADVSLDWQVANTGDFDGDGRSDILWRNVDGKVAIWEMDGVAVKNSGTVADPGADWLVAGVADYNGDGRSDILFQHPPTGGDSRTEMQVLTMNGLNVAAVGNSAYISNDWQTV
ncbi:MAG: FG-GAP repeat domain-containing protein, partial [Paracraurococcus sp.]